MEGERRSGDRVRGCVPPPDLVEVGSEGRRINGRQLDKRWNFGFTRKILYSDSNREGTNLRKVVRGSRSFIPFRKTGPEFLDTLTGQMEVGVGEVRQEGQW